MALGRNTDVFTGIDTWGRNTYGGGGFNVHKALAKIKESETSVALFAPAWTFEFFDGDNFELYESRFWLDSNLKIPFPLQDKEPSTKPDEKNLGCIADFMYLLPAQLADGLYTNFDSGFGSSYFIDGRVMIVFYIVNLAKRKLESI